MFYAKWRGWCAECGDDWEEGDEIGYVDDELCCGDCVFLLNEEGYFL